MDLHEYELWCLACGAKECFIVDFPGIASIGTLRRRIWDLCRLGVDATDLVLYQVDENVDNNIGSTIANGTYLPANPKMLASDSTSISDVWPAVPNRNDVHVFVSLRCSLNFWEAARLLHNRMWGVNLNSILEKVPDGREKYLPRAQVDSLHLCALGFAEDALLVCKEYITAIRLLQEPIKWTRGVAITGKPGIGKMCFLYYVLLYCMSRKKTTVLQFYNKFHVIFEKRGCFMHPSTNPDSEAFPKESWVLVGPQIAGPFLDNLWAWKAHQAFVIQPSPPKQSHHQHKCFRKHHGFTYVMQHFSASEFISLGKVLGLDGEALHRHSQKWGPSARLCLTLERQLLLPEQCIKDAQRAAAQFVAEFSPTLYPSLDAAADLPYMLFNFIPYDLLDLDFSGRTGFRVEVATDYLDKFIIQAREQSVITELNV